MTLETFTLQEKNRFLQGFFFVGIVWPVLSILILWSNDLELSPYVIVWLFMGYLYFMGVLYYFSRRNQPSRIHVQGSRLLLEMSEGNTELDIVANQVHFHVTYIGGKNSHVRYELWYRAGKKIEVFSLAYFDYKDANRLNLYLGQFSYEADEEWENVPVFDPQGVRRDVGIGFFAGLAVLVYILLPGSRKYVSLNPWILFLCLLGLVLVYMLVQYIVDRRSIPKSLVFEENALVIDGHRFVLSNLKLARIRGLEKGPLILLLVDQEEKNYRFYLGFDAFHRQEGHPDVYRSATLLEKQFRKYYYDGHLADLELVYWNEIPS